MSDKIKKQNEYLNEFSKGIIKENPVFILLLGLCPVLAVSSMVANGIGMGLAATFVLLGSNILISLLKDFIPEKVRIPAYIVIIASFVTIVEMLMNAFVPFLARSLGIFVPLIVVNCIILGRAEAFASKNKIGDSIMDALGMGLGFTVALFTISFIRELLGTCLFDFSGYVEKVKFALWTPFIYVNKNTSQVFLNIFGKQIEIYSGAFVFISPSGAFFVIGLLLAGINVIKSKFIEKEKK
ncbi:MAG: electron transport complex subunit E [Spirochaetes bacterium]|nr:electron transport complex subunit E [Spirochaetota bacterium]